MFVKKSFPEGNLFFSRMYRIQVQIFLALTAYPSCTLALSLLSNKNCIREILFGTW